MLDIKAQNFRDAVQLALQYSKGPGGTERGQLVNRARVTHAWWTVEGVRSPASWGLHDIH